MKNYSTFVSEDLTEILRSLDIEQKTMYCFRHTVLNRLKQKKVAPDVTRDLVGHEGKTTKEKFYEQKFPAEILKEDTEKVLCYDEVPFFKKM
jgi:integrase